MNRYYLVDLGTNPQQRQRLIDGLQRDLPDNSARAQLRDRLHYALSLDGRWLLANVNTTDKEHANLIGRSQVTYLGDQLESGLAPETVYEYLRQNTSLWTPEHPDGV